MTSPSFVKNVWILLHWAMMTSALFALLVLLAGTAAFLPAKLSGDSVSWRRFGSVGGSRWEDHSCFEVEVLGEAYKCVRGMEATTVPVTFFPSLGDYHEQPTPEEMEDIKRKASFNMNVGKAMETLRNELPLVFASSNLDFSIFAEQIAVTDHRSNRAMMPKSIYVAAVKSLRMAGALSTLFPSMNVKKIEYIESNGFIQCLVDVVLPDNVRVDGQAVWEGMFYFGLNEEGLIDSHVFDRQITSFTPQAQISKMPWLRSSAVVDFGSLQGALAAGAAASSSHPCELADLLVASFAEGEI